MTAEKTETKSNIADDLEKAFNQANLEGLVSNTEILLFESLKNNLRFNDKLGSGIVSIQKTILNRLHQHDEHSVSNAEKQMIKDIVTTLKSLTDAHGEMVTLNDSLFDSLITSFRKSQD